jgi:hypothetical protein
VGTNGVGWWGGLTGLMGTNGVGWLGAGWTSRMVVGWLTGLAGYMTILCIVMDTCSDTAGLRDSDDPIEQEGVRRALKRCAGCVCSFE